jgi:hypothetical protein
MFVGKLDSAKMPTPRMMLSKELILHSNAADLSNHFDDFPKKMNAYYDTV